MSKSNQVTANRPKEQAEPSRRFWDREPDHQPLLQPKNKRLDGQLRSNCLTCSSTPVCWNATTGLWHCSLDYAIRQDPHPKSRQQWSIPIVPCLPFSPIVIKPLGASRGNEKLGSILVFQPHRLRRSQYCIQQYILTHKVFGHEIINLAELKCGRIHFTSSLIEWIVHHWRPFFSFSEGKFFVIPAKPFFREWRMKNAFVLSLSLTRKCRKGNHHHVVAQPICNALHSLKRKLRYPAIHCPVVRNRIRDRNPCHPGFNRTPVGCIFLLLNIVPLSPWCPNLLSLSLSLSLL